MTTTTREERTGESLMDPADFAAVVARIQDIHDVAKYDARIALDQAIATVMTAAAVSEVRRENLWVSVPVDQAWQTWRADPLLYSKIAVAAGAYVDRVQMIDAADPGQVIRTAEVIEDEGFALHREAWYGRAGANAIALVKSRLMTPAPVRREV
jgi:hypothetical protein